MNRDESKKILMVIQSAYPNFNPPDKSVAVDTWQVMLSDYSYEQVLAALKAFIRSDNKGFAPSVGQVIEKIQLLFNQPDSGLNEIAAWGMVLKAVRNSGYNAETEFERLPPLVQKAVVSPAQLREWALMEDLDGTGLNVMQSNFMRTFRREQERQKEIGKLSPELLRLIQEPAEALAIGGKPKEIAEQREDERTLTADEIAEKVRRAKERMYERQHSKGEGNREEKQGAAGESQPMSE